MIFFEENSFWSNYYHKESLLVSAGTLWSVKFPVFEDFFDFLVILFFIFRRLLGFFLLLELNFSAFRLFFLSLTVFDVKFCSFLIAL